MPKQITRPFRAPGHEGERQVGNIFVIGVSVVIPTPFTSSCRFMRCGCNHGGGVISLDLSLRKHSFEVVALNEDQTATTVATPNLSLG